MIDFSTLKRPRTPNTALYADDGDTPSTADAPALHLLASPATVLEAWDKVVRDAPRTTVEHRDDADGTHHAVQRSRLFRFPDDIYAKAAAQDGGTRLMLYSAARYGKGDMNVNAKRLAAWSEALKDALDAR